MTAGIFVHSATGPHVSLATGIVVAVPTIADAEADEVEVDVSGSGFDFTLILGDVVLVAEEAALPTSCLFAGAHVTDTDKISFTFDTLEGASGVTGANVNYTVLAFDTTP